MAHLRKVRAGGSVADQMWALRADLLRNLGNMTNRRGGACRRGMVSPCSQAGLSCGRLPHLCDCQPQRPAPLLRAAALVTTANRSEPHTPASCSALHEHFPVIPEAIREYIEEVKAQLEEVTLSPGGQAAM